MMLSRVAENIYWMARYLERAENTARLINATTDLLLDIPWRASIGWGSVIEILGSEEDFYQRHSVPLESAVMDYIVRDAEYGGSILSTLSAARENARIIRDVIPNEAWEQINGLYLSVSENAAAACSSQRGRSELLREIILRCELIMGIMHGSMSHDEAYQFVRLGHAVEQADMTTRIVDVRSANLVSLNDPSLQQYASVAWLSVLKSLSAQQMYQRHVQSRVRGQDVSQFLLKDDLFPRSVTYCLNRLLTALSCLPVAPIAHQRAMRVLDTIADAEHFRGDELHAFIDELQIGFKDIHESLADAFFRYEEHDWALPLDDCSYQRKLSKSLVTRTMV